MSPENLRIFSWSTNSLDMNIIKNRSSVVETRIRKRERKNIIDVSQYKVTEEGWYLIGPNYIKKLYK